jgi:hypothetical protein
VTVPVEVPLAIRPEVTIGTTVMSATLLGAGTTPFVRNYAPSYRTQPAQRGFPALGCPTSSWTMCSGHEGYVPEDFRNDEGINRIFNQGSGRIAAAILIDIDLPETVEQ